MLAGSDIARGGLHGPVENRLDRALLETDARLAEGVTDAVQSGDAQLLGRREVPEQMPGNRTVPELVEAGSVAGQGCFEVVADLTVESGALAY